MPQQCALSDNQTEKTFTPALEAAVCESLIYDPATLPPVQTVFPLAPEKPPISVEAALEFLKTVSINLPNAIGDIISPMILNDKQVAIKTFSHPLVKFTLRPLQRFTFAIRSHIHHSIILQLDGLLFAVFRLRLERDVCATAASESFCANFGAGVSPASSFCGLYMPPPPLLRAVILAVKQERGYGIFVGPASSDAWLPPTITLYKELLSFSFTGADASPWRGVLLSFAYQGKLTRKKKDVHFDLSVLLHKHVPVCVGITPFCPARISSLPFSPKASDDTAKASPPLGKAPDIPKPVQNQVWNAPAMNKLSTLFPNKDVADMFMQAVSLTGASLLFVGDRSKRVAVANGELDASMLHLIRERFVSETAKNRMMGPFTRCPFPNDWNAHQARNTPLDTRRKDKYDPLSQRFRVISNFSAGRSCSINALIYSPKLIASHLQCTQLRDTLFHMGPQARFSAIDQEDAFRADHIRLEDAHLYCYQVGSEWFVDLRDPFGNIKSEYTYAIVVAVLKWAFECDASIVAENSRLLGYVDNWFLLSPRRCATHDMRWQRLKCMFSLLGAPMHEEQDSRAGIVNALGWDWDLKLGSFSCPEDKYLNCLKLTKAWAERAARNDSFTFTEIESLAGLFQWISTACPSIISSVASLQALKHALKRSGVATRKLDDRSKVAVIDLASFFMTWNRTCPIFAGFSPANSWEVLIKVDASTDFGAGGFCMPAFDYLIHEWSPDERRQAMAHSEHAIRESTTFFELLSILRSLQRFAQFLDGKRVQIECDNEAAVRDLICCFSGKPMCMIVIADIRNFCALHHISPRFEHILSDFNMIADRLSHNDFVQASTLCLQEFSHPLLSPPRL